MWDARGLANCSTPLFNVSDGQTQLNKPAGGSDHRLGPAEDRLDLVMLLRRLHANERARDGGE
jgi:hypothetical protein